MQKLRPKILALIVVLGVIGVSIIVGIWIWDRYHPDVSIIPTQELGPSPLLVPAMISTPEHALEEFIQSMEADDIEKTLSFFSYFVRDAYANIMQGADLRLIAQDMRELPPERIDLPQEDDHLATFVIQRTVQGKKQTMPIMLRLEGGSWKILEF